MVWRRAHPHQRVQERHASGRHVFPEVEQVAHAADLGLSFYTGDMFPAKYKGAIFSTQHGSWNRTVPVGARVMVTFLKDDGHVAGPSIPFAEGWNDNGHYLGRPVDVAAVLGWFAARVRRSRRRRLPNLVRRKVKQALIAKGQLRRALGLFFLRGSGLVTGDLCFPRCGCRRERRSSLHRWLFCFGGPGPSAGARRREGGTREGRRHMRGLPRPRRAVESAEAPNLAGSPRTTCSPSWRPSRQESDRTK